MTIERAAKAIVEKGQTSSANGLARAALESIAEPTPEMIEAGSTRGGVWLTEPEQIAGIWRAMHAEMMNSQRTSAGNSRELWELGAYESII